MLQSAHSCEVAEPGHRTPMVSRTVHHGKSTLCWQRELESVQIYLKKNLVDHVLHPHPPPTPGSISAMGTLAGRPGFSPF